MFVILNTPFLFGSLISSTRPESSSTGSPEIYVGLRPTLTESRPVKSLLARVNAR